MWERNVARRIALTCVVVVLAGCSAAVEEAPADSPADSPEVATSIDAAALDAFITTQLEELHIPGLAVAILGQDGVLYSAGYGWADVANRVPMTPDTVMNIASISKTVTNAAVLQLRDQGRLDLDDDVSEHLPFTLRHPAHPETPITVRQLLTHVSAITDAEAYDASYACGDPAVALADWVRGYLEPGGAYFDAEQNFLPTAPGEAHSYSNVGYGLLGYLVEVVSGEAFADYTQSHIFAPLGMDDSGWFLSDIEANLQAVPYAWVEAGETLDNALFAERNGESIEETGFVPFCSYSFYNIPDGLVRTSVHQLARFLRAHMRGGELDSQRILAAATVEEILSTQLEPSMIEGERFIQGLTWRRQELEIGEFWGHSGGDPGVRTHAFFSPEAGRGVILFANRATRVTPILQRLLEEALR